MTETSWPGSSLETRVRQAIDEVRPALRADGGDVALVRIDGDVVTVHLLGACHGCPMARTTLTDFVGERIRLWAPEITRVAAE
jgi:Fe-S cluster biogenesis protein NfuA